MGKDKHRFTIISILCREALASKGGLNVNLEFMASSISFGWPGLFLFIGYIINQTFPQPLSEEQEKLCLQRFYAGDEEAKNLLIEHNLRLVAHILKKFDGTGEEVDDLISIGTIGLIKAINTFNPDKGAKLATYAARCIENERMMTRVGLARSI